MHEPAAGRGGSGTVRRPVLLGLFTGTAVGLGFLLAGVPNLELMSLVAALAGAVLGPGWGFSCGALAAGIYSLGSPYGLPVPLILAGQMLGLGVTGLLGGVTGPVLYRLAGGGRRAAAAALAATVGLLGTLVFEVLTNLAIVLAFDAAWGVVAAGAALFFLIHAGTNTMIFASFLPLLVRRLGRLGSSPLIGGVLLAAVMCATGPASAAPAADQAAAAADSVREDSGLEGNGQEDNGQEVNEQEPPTPAPGQTSGLVRGWQRPLWEPFAPSPVGRLDWDSNWIPVSDGGLGAVTRILGEVSTSPVPLIVRDGLPQGTGHVLADDPWLMPQIGYRLDAGSSGLDRWGGTGGRIDLDREDPRPGDAVSSYLGAKGKHQTFLRGVRLLTPIAPWRFGFEFEESLDQEGYNYTSLPDLEFDPEPDEYFPGHGRVRHSHARLTRTLAEHADLAVDYDNGRKTKDSLPALGAAQQELWDDGLAVSMRGRWGRLGLTAAAHLRNRDVSWGPKLTPADSTRRLLETGRDGVVIELAWHDQPWWPPLAAVPPPVPGDAPPPGADRDSLQTAADSSAVAVAPDPDPETPPRAATAREPLTRLSLALDEWTVNDSGADSAWAGPAGGPVAVSGRRARLALQTGRRSGPVVMVARGGGLWDERLGWDPELAGEVRPRGGRPAWTVFWERGGRAPRSDELATALRHFVDGRELVLLPAADLDREKTTRYGARWAGHLLGLDLALEGARIRLRRGIAWRADPDQEAQGRWGNGLDLDADRVTAAVGRQGRFWGWGRAFFEGTWQKFDILEGSPSLLPPERYLRLRLMWENHFFQEDGILQLALLSTRTGEMADPWDVTRTLMVPERTVHDLLVGFRLVGANISMAVRNLTGQKHRLTGGAYSSAQEIDLRLSWTFVH